MGPMRFCGLSWKFCKSTYFRRRIERNLMNSTESSLFWVWFFFPHSFFSFIWSATAFEVSFLSRFQFSFMFPFSFLFLEWFFFDFDCLGNLSDLRFYRSNSLCSILCLLQVEWNRLELNSLLPDIVFTLVSLLLFLWILVFWWWFLVVF